MYGAYTEINQLLVRDAKVSLSTVEEIPEILPDTGLAVFDKRRKDSWKKELEKYLTEKKEYTGEIFDYNKMWKCIESIATRFILEILK